MRFFSWMVVLGMGALAGGASLAGCGDDSGGDTGGTGTTPEASCEQTNPLCTAVESECVALFDNRERTKFGLRMAQLTITKPDILAGPAIGKVVSDAVRMNLQQCRLNGTGTFSWLIEFDTMTGTARTGGALPQADPTKGYCFVDTTVGAFPIQAIEVPAPITDGRFDADVGDLIVPIYLGADPGGTPITLPLHQAKLSDGTVTADNNCIGRYNAEGLDPDNLCLADDVNPTFINGAKLTAFITIEEADSVEVEDLGQSLCVILSGDANTYGDGGDPISHCLRDAGGAINLKGDWCAATNSAATASCQDAFQLGAEFAASAVEITGTCP